MTCVAALTNQVRNVQFDDITCENLLEAPPCERLHRMLAAFLWWYAAMPGRNKPVVVSFGTCGHTTDGAVHYTNETWGTQLHYSARIALSTIGLRFCVMYEDPRLVEIRAWLSPYGVEIDLSEKHKQRVKVTIGDCFGFQGWIDTTNDLITVLLDRLSMLEWFIPYLHPVR